MRVIVGGWTCSTAQRSLIVRRPAESTEDSAASIDGVIPGSASRRSFRARRVTPRRSRAASAAVSGGAVVRMSR